MSSEPPKGFEKLGDIAEKDLQSSFSTIGIVTEYMPAYKTSKDYMLTFNLTDHSWSEGLGLKFRFFGKEEESIPDIHVDDVVVIRSFKLKRYSGDLLGLSHLESSWIVFARRDILTGHAGAQWQIPFSKMTPKVPSPSQRMMEYAAALFNTLARNEPERPPVGLTGAAHTPKPGKFQLIQDLVPPRRQGVLKFTDLLGEVQRIYKNDFLVELAISDYTSNNALYNNAPGSEDGQGPDGDEFNHTYQHSSGRGPWGKMSIKVALWDPHARFAREHVGLNNLVFLQNVQICLGETEGIMEGKLRGDRFHPEKIRISILRPQHAKEDNRVKALLKRKRNYEAELKLHGTNGLQESNILKTEAAQQQQVDTSRPSKKGKGKLKREKLKAMKEEEAEAASGSKASSRNALQPSIRINKVPSTITPVKISEINDTHTLRAPFDTSNGNPITLPFKNNHYHLHTIRCIDFHPPNLADFAAPHKASEYECLSDYESAPSPTAASDLDITDVVSDSTDVTWEWRFELLIEDADTRHIPSRQPEGAQDDEGKGSRTAAEASSHRIRLLVAGNDAEFLLRDIRATDLRKDPGTLARLREKLFLLWGDLQERKEEEEQERQRRKKDTSKDQMDSGQLSPSAEGDPGGGGGGGAKPFECLVREYGVQVNNESQDVSSGEWGRVFAMFGTTIVN